MKIKQIQPLMLLLLIGLIGGCKGKKIVSNASEEAVTSAPSPIEVVAKDFSKAVINDDVELLKKYFADAAIARSLSPKAKEMSDDEIQTSMLEALHNRFITNFEAIQTNIAANNYDRSMLSFGGYKYYETDDPITVPRALSVSFKVGDKVETTTITALLMDNRVYLFEILNTTNVFVGD